MSGAVTHDMAPVLSTLDFLCETAGRHAAGLASEVDGADGADIIDRTCSLLMDTRAAAQRIPATGARSAAYETLEVHRALATVRDLLRRIGDLLSTVVVDSEGAVREMQACHRTVQCAALLATYRPPVPVEQPGRSSRSGGWWRC